MFQDHQITKLYDSVSRLSSLFWICLYLNLMKSENSFIYLMFHGPIIFPLSTPRDPTQSDFSRS